MQEFIMTYMGLIIAVLCAIWGVFLLFTFEEAQDICRKGIEAEVSE